MTISADGPCESILVGRISGLFGVQGWLKVYSWMRPPQQIFDFKDWWLADEEADQADQAVIGSRHKVLDARIHGKGLVVQLQDCEDRDQAASLVNRKIYVAKESFPVLEDGEYYWHQLIGLEVRNQDQVVLGVVENMLETGANDVLELKGERQRLLPYIPSVVLVVDLEKRQILVDWDLAF